MYVGRLIILIMKFKKYIKNFLKFMRAGGVVYAPVSFVNANDRFRDKIILVTGGSSGIGYETAKQFLNEGGKVIITGRREDRIIEALDKLQSDNIKYLVWDISDVSIADSKLQEANSLFGHIDIFVNNAGVFKYDNWSKFDETTYDSIVDTNSKGLFFVCQAEGKYFITNKMRGKILNICSCFGIDARFDPYSISKWGSVCITKGLAKELVKYGIVVNGVAPGSVPTNITGNLVNVQENAYAPEHLTKRWVLTEEVASLLLFLASDSANSIIGQVITVDGGYSLH